MAGDLKPELFDNVPLKAIASYLKMTEVHVSRIRKSIVKRKEGLTKFEYFWFLCNKINIGYFFV